MQILAGALPKGVQSFLMSATLTDDVEQLKDLFCRHPLVYKPDQKEEQDGKSGMSQYYIRYGSLLLQCSSMLPWEARLLTESRASG